MSLFLSCILWFLYGMLIKNMNIVLVNVVGFNLEAIYIMVYLYYTQNKVFILFFFPFRIEI